MFDDSSNRKFDLVIYKFLHIYGEHATIKSDKVNISITKNFRDQNLVICNVIIINSFIISHLLF